MLTEKEFLFGARMPLLSGIRRFCFLSEASLETATFKDFICFIFFIFYFLIPTEANKKKLLGDWKRSVKRRN